MPGLVRRERERVDKETFEQLKAEFTHAFAAAEPSYQPLTAARVITPNQA